MSQNTSLPTDRKLAALLKGLSISVFSVAMTIAFIEVICRMASVDFNKIAIERVPIFYRLPTIECGEIYFCRQGPAAWSGKVIQTMCRQAGYPTNEYDEQDDVVIRYDAEGFRNPEGLQDWEIAIAGDSFVEAGYLPYEKLFTSLLADQTRQKVKNLGVSSIGPLNALYYLKSYGITSRTRHLILVFFEGNDIMELIDEHSALIQFHETGYRPKRGLTSERSLLRFAVSALTKPKNALLPPAEGIFIAHSRSVPVSLWYTPPDPDSLPDGFTNALHELLSQFAALAREHRCKAYLLLMPCKFRVLFTRLKLADSAPPRFHQWNPNDLSRIFRDACMPHGIAFIDAAKVLKRETAQGVLTYNGTYDSHLNAYGNQIIANLLFEQLTEPAQHEWSP